MYLNLSQSQREVVEAIEKDKNVFVTGPAGTGKSYLLNYLKQEYLKKGLHVTASTGIAAVNISGTTLHSWAGIGLGNLPLDQTLSRIFSGKGIRLRRKIRGAKMLAIDEISMISSDTLNLVNNVLKAIKETDEPFGGLQIILFGDFLQLPPIVDNFSNTDDTEHFCFNSEAWQEANLKTFVLKEIFRQTDNRFIQLLNNLRFGKIEKDDIEILKERYNVEDNNKSIKPTILGTHNYKIEQINYENLKMLPSKEYVFIATFEGSEKKFDFLRKNCIAPESLKLKVGAQVMMLKNTYKADGIINGSLGIVRDFSPNKKYPIVEFSNGNLITVGPEKWVIEKFDEKKKKMVEETSLTQIPLLLAWAITIHKSQGMTLDKIECDLENAFAEGQIYVALSRVKDLSGLFIKSFNVNKIRVNSTVAEFYYNQ
ncbi:DEAD/DEAH box helicase [Pseudomonadota bacterium]